MSKTAKTVEGLIADTVKSLGVDLWDVTFTKEGASYYLRVYIDKPGGVDIDDCVNVSRAIDPIIDEADPIEVSYTLEVSSPGIERELTKSEHFSKLNGETVTVYLYKAEDGKREISGKLLDFDGGVKIETDGETKYFAKGAFSKVILKSY